MKMKNLKPAIKSLKNWYKYMGPFLRHNVLKKIEKYKVNECIMIKF